MPIDADELTERGDDLETVTFEVGQGGTYILVDIDSTPHLNFDTGEQEYTKAGKPKTKWIARLRKPGATDAGDDRKWWTQNQVKFELMQAVKAHPNNYLGATVKIERKPDGEPRQKGYRGPAVYSVEIIEPGPTGWEDPLTRTSILDDEEPF